MYLKYKKYKEHSDRVYLQVVESVREGKYVRKNTILSLGRFDNHEAVDRVNKFLKVLLLVSDKVQTLEPSKDISPLQSKQYDLY